MKRNRKFLSLILALALVFSMVPVGAFAVSKPGKVKNVKAKVIEEGTNKVKVSWKRIKNCKGYQIFLVNGSSQKSLGYVSGSKKVSANVCVNIEKAGKVKFKVRAYNTYKVKKGKKLTTKKKFGAKSNASNSVSVKVLSNQAPKTTKNIEPGTGGSGTGGNSGTGGSGTTEKKGGNSLEEDATTEER